MSRMIRQAEERSGSSLQNLLRSASRGRDREKSASDAESSPCDPRYRPADSGRKNGPPDPAKEERTARVSPDVKRGVPATVSARQDRLPFDGPSESAQDSRGKVKESLPQAKRAQEPPSARRRKEHTRAKKRGPEGTTDGRKRVPGGDDNPEKEQRSRYDRGKNQPEAFGRKATVDSETWVAVPTEEMTHVRSVSGRRRFLSHDLSAEDAARRRSPRQKDEAAAKPKKQENAGVLASLLEGIEEGVAHVRANGEILYTNRRFAELLDGHPERMRDGECRLQDFVEPASWADLEKGLQAAARRPMEGTLRTLDDGTERIVRLLLTPIHWKKRTTVKITASETTELVEKNRELQDKEVSLHALSARIMQLQDEERRRIARDLHDITGQELAVVIMQMMEIMKYERSQDAKEKITDATQLVRKVEEEIRTLSYVLHPPLLDEFGLGSALNWYAEGFTKRSRIQVDVECAPNVPRLAAEKEMALFRVLQEGLTNVMRHSGSRKARIGLQFDAEFVALTVEDEGRGIAPRKLAEMATRMESGVGIAGMRERLQQFGGSLKINAREHGTALTAMMPIGEAPPIEEPPTEAELLRMAETPGYKYERQGGQEAGERATVPAPDQTGQAVEKKRVLIVDDDEVTRQGIRTLLKDEGEIEICGEAKDGLEAVMIAKELDPDLVIMDLTMPSVGGFSAAHQIRNSGLHAKILLFTTHDSPEMEQMSRIAGFDGLVQKRDAARDLVRGVRAVLKGKRFYGSQEVGNRTEITRAAGS
jgi:PAS domain S-box-containing protein